MRPVAIAPLLLDDVVTDDSRYGIYERGDDGSPHELATTSRDGIGLTIVTLTEERRADLEARGEPVGVPLIGILDRLERRWITGIWARRGPA